MDKLKSGGLGLVSVLNLLCSAVLLGGVLWKGGEMTRQIAVNTARLDRIETDGSPSVRALKAELSALQSELKYIREDVRVLPDIRVELSKNGQKMDDLKATLDEHKKQTMTLK